MGKYLTQIELKRIVNLYESRYDEYGHNHNTVGWGSKIDQILRFDVLCRNINLKGKRILDVGCGLGDLVPYIEDVTDGDFHYTGIDVAPSLIAAAKKKFQHPNVQFKCGDISSSLGESMFDVSILSGALNYRINDNIGNTEMVLSELFKITKETMSVNFLSSYVDYQEDKNFHYSPEAMLSFAKSLSTWVSIYHDYPLWEFTIQVRHNPIK